jgi:hypothetical protein
MANTLNNSQGYEVFRNHVMQDFKEKMAPENKEPGKKEVPTAEKFPPQAMVDDIDKRLKVLLDSHWQKRKKIKVVSSVEAKKKLEELNKEFSDDLDKFLQQIKDKNNEKLSQEQKEKLNKWHEKISDDYKKELEKAASNFIDYFEDLEYKKYCASVSLKREERREELGIHGGDARDVSKNIRYHPEGEKSFTKKVLLSIFGFGYLVPRPSTYEYGATVITVAHGKNDKGDPTISIIGNNLHEESSRVAMIEAAAFEIARLKREGKETSNRLHVTLGNDKVNPETYKECREIALNLIKSGILHGIPNPDQKKITDIYTNPTKMFTDPTITALMVYDPTKESIEVSVAGFTPTQKEMEEIAKARNFRAQVENNYNQCLDNFRVHGETRTNNADLDAKFASIVHFGDDAHKKFRKSASDTADTAGSSVAPTLPTAPNASGLPVTPTPSASPVNNTPGLKS